MTDEQPQLDLASFLKIGRSLLAGWDARADKPHVGSGRREYTPANLAVAHGLCAHAHYVASPGFDLLEAGRVLAAIPLVRVAYECGITAQWVVQTVDGTQAFINEDLRQRRNQVKVLEEAASTAFQEAAPEVAGQIIADLDAQASARRFDQICDDLTPGGKDAYATYRSMSHLSHASVLVVDQYLQEIDAPPELALRVEPNEPNAAAWAAILASSLVWAGRAIDYLDAEKIRRSELRDAARQLGITSELQLSESAVVREGPRRR